MVVQQPTLLEGSVLGLLQGTASYALTASYANNIIDQDVLMWYGRVPALTTGINLYLNSSSDATLPYDNNKVYTITTNIVGKDLSGKRETFNQGGSSYPIFVYRSGSVTSNINETFNIYNSNVIIDTQLNSGSANLMVLSGSKDAYNKLKFTVNFNDITITHDVYITLKTLQVIDLNALPSTI